MRVVCLLVAALLLNGCYTTKVPDTGVSSKSRQKAISYSKSKASKKMRRPAVYTVTPNDTLYSIGKRFGIDYHIIAKRNRLRSPYRIYVGQHLHITRLAPPSQSKSIAKQMNRAAVKTTKKKIRKKKESCQSFKTLA